uniref:T-complex protein 1 subunit theta n=1 Tax=Lygus hesperus TaxID=30085 RepID=A0A146L1C1_LYGHE
MNKMILNNLDKVVVTSDTVTILHETEVEHPAAKLLVSAAKEQEREIGDGSNWVLCIGGELLHNSENLLRLGIPATAIAEGYRKAVQYILEIINSLTLYNVCEKDLFDEVVLAKMIQSSIASKQFGLEVLLSKLVSKACQLVMPRNTYNLNVDDIRVVKIFGSDIYQSFVLHGMVLQLVPHTRTIYTVQDATVAIFTCTIDAADTETKGTALLTSAQELSSFNIDEEKQIER